MTKVSAIFENGVFRPIEPVKLGEGSRIELSFEQPVSTSVGRGLRDSFGAWAGAAAELDQFVEDARRARKSARRTPVE